MGADVIVFFVRALSFYVSKGAEADRQVRLHGWHHRMHCGVCFQGLSSRLIWQCCGGCEAAIAAWPHFWPSTGIPRAIRRLSAGRRTRAAAGSNLGCHSSGYAQQILQHVRHSVTWLQDPAAEVQTCLLHARRVVCFQLIWLQSERLPFWPAKDKHCKCSERSKYRGTVQSVLLAFHAHSRPTLANASYAADKSPDT